MIKKKTKKAICWFAVIFQGISIIVTVINLIYCFITKSTNLFPFSNVALFIPQYYITYGDGIWNIIPLLLFFIVTVFLYCKSSLIIIGVKRIGVKKSNYFFVALNGFWLIWCNLSYILFFTFNTSTVMSIPPYSSFINMYIWIVFIYIYIFVIFVIFNENNLLKDIKLKMSISTYRNIKEYSYTNSLIAFFTIILAFWMHYFSDMPLSNPNGINMNFLDYMLYPIFWIINIILFIITIMSYFKVKKISNEPLPCNHFLLKINLYQIISIILSVISFYLTAFILF